MRISTTKKIQEFQKRLFYKQKEAQIIDNEIFVKMNYKYLNNAYHLHDKKNISRSTHYRYLSILEKFNKIERKKNAFMRISANQLINKNYSLIENYCKKNNLQGAESKLNNIIKNNADLQKYYEKFSLLMKELNYKNYKNFKMLALTKKQVETLCKIGANKCFFVKYTFTKKTDNARNATTRYFLTLPTKELIKINRKTEKKATPQNLKKQIKKTNLRTDAAKNSSKKNDNITNYLNTNYKNLTKKEFQILYMIAKYNLQNFETRQMILHLSKWLKESEKTIIQNLTAATNKRIF